MVEFDKNLYLQKWGTSMGASCSPGYADLFMDNFEREFLGSIPQRLKNKIFEGFYKRYLDDVFLLWQGTAEEFGEFWDLLNSFWTNIGFTMESDFATRSTSFLDVNIQIVGGTLNTDLYTKPTAAN